MEHACVHRLPKLSVVRTAPQSRMVISEEEDKALEVAHVKRALRQCESPDWVVERGVAPPKEKDSTWERETESG